MTNQDNTQAELREAVKRFCRTDEAAENLVQFIAAHTNKAIADVLDRLGETIPFSNSTSDELDKSNTHLDSRSQQYWSAYNRGYISMSDQTKKAIQAERQKLTIKELK